MSMLDDALHIPGLRESPGCSTHALRRMMAGELEGEAAAQLRQHLSACSRCRSSWSALEEEQRRFASEIPFEPFAERVRGRAARARPARHVWRPALAAAAAMMLVVWAGPRLFHASETESPRNRIKGGGALQLYIGGAGATPRLARAGEPLAPGERVRVGYSSAGHRYIAVISIDEQGEVSPLYPESGVSLRSADGSGPHLMPDSLEFSGPGFERVVAIFSNAPLPIEQVAEAARREFERAGALERMAPLGIGDEESAQLLLKP